MPSDHEPIPPLEWITAAMGLAVALALIVIIGRDALVHGDRETPDFDVRVERITATPHGHVVHILVTNQAGQTAAAVQVEGRIGDETSQATINYVPGRSKAEGGLLFRGDPRRQRLDVRVTGYQLP